jgi:uncharacterized protein YaaQ
MIYCLYGNRKEALMKLIFAIVRKEDSGAVIEQLNLNHYSVTKLATTGGFLRRGNVTLLIGTEEDLIATAIDIIKKECGKRKQIMYNMPYGGNLTMDHGAAVPIPVDVGGATVFVVDVDHFEKI